MRAYHALSRAEAEQALAEYVERLPGLVDALRARPGVPVLVVAVPYTYEGDWRLHDHSP